MNNNIENINKVHQYLINKTENAHASRYKDIIKLYGLNHLYVIAVSFMSDSVVIRKINKKTVEVIDDIEILDPNASSELIINLLDSILIVVSSEISSLNKNWRI